MDAQTLAIIKVRNAREKHAVKQLGGQIGYGRLMQLAQECWQEYDPTGAFAYGPCIGMTVPCGCSGICEWCNGAKWLTPKVKAIKDSMA
jgi:hypothetical protein